MRSIFTCSGLMLILLVFFVAGSWAGVVYDPPEGGWTYKYEADMWDNDDMFALDGFWSHDDGSDAWDGTPIGDGLPGGLTDYVEIADGDTTTFIRMQDPGDPRQYGFSDPSNRKIYLGYDITLNDALPGDSTLLDDGVTISFRTRVAVPGGDFELDALHPADGLGEDDWPATGDGYIVHDGGKGNFSVRQLAGGTISFCLAVQTDHAYLDSALMKDGLVMNRKVGNMVSGDVDWQGDFAYSDTLDQAIKDSLAQHVNFLELDPREWHEFWITIEGVDTSVVKEATHKVNIYMDGSTEPAEFMVTAGSGSDFAGAYIAMGVGATPQSGAYDVDFYAYAPGVHVPAGGSAVADNRTVPTSYSLAQNYPNPFNPTTNIQYSLAKSGHVTLTVFDLLGRKVQHVVDAFQAAGDYDVNFDASNLESGIYFYKLQVGDSFTDMKKMILMK